MIETSLTKGLYAGSFDPMTIGHINIIEKASKMFAQLYVVIAQNPEKQSFFHSEKRLAIALKSVEHLSNVEVFEIPNGMTTIELAEQLGVDFLVRGIRNERDMQYELTLADMNETLNSTISTVFIKGSKELGSVSSTLVRDLIKMKSPKAKTFYKDI